MLPGACKHPTVCRVKLSLILLSISGILIGYVEAVELFQQPPYIFLCIKRNTALRFSWNTSVYFIEMYFICLHWTILFTTKTSLYAKKMYTSFQNISFPHRFKKICDELWGKLPKKQITLNSCLCSVYLNEKFIFYYLNLKPVFIFQNFFFHSIFSI